MKKTFTYIIAILAIFTVGCDKYDDSLLMNRVDELEERLSALETVMNAYENELFIESIDEINNGYVITFSDGSKATITNGIDGKPGEDGDTLIDSIVIGENEVTFNLTDERSFSIPLHSALSISFESEDLVVMQPNSTRDIRYTIHSFIPNVDIEAISSADIKVKVLPNKDSNLNGSIKITTGATLDEYSKVVVFVSNDERVIMKSLSFEEAGIEVVDNTIKSCGAEGGAVALEYMSNMECEVVIPEEAQDWISVVPLTRALEYNAITLQLEPNMGCTRSAIITIQSIDGTLCINYNITQYGNQDAEIERNALIAIYNALGGENWTNNTNWCSDKPLGEWYGVTVNEYGSVYSLFLTGNNLDGYLPAEIGDLLHMRRIYCQANNIHGEIPTEMANLKNLEFLWLDGSHFTNVTAIYNIKSLKHLQISLGTNILPEIGNLTNLNHLTLYDISGEIPSEIGNLSELEYFRVCRGDSYLTGGIPASIGNCTKLKVLDLCYCGLSGSIPEQLGSCTELEEIYLHINNFSGNIPQWLGNCKNLRILELNDNRLSGEIPSNLGESPSLEYLCLFNNSLYGEIPLSIQNNDELWKYCWAYIVQGNKFNSESYKIIGPDFSVTDLSGVNIDSKKMYAKNKYTVLLQFSPSFNDFTSIEAFKAVYESFKNRGVDFIGYCNVSTEMGEEDDESSVRDFVKQYNIAWHTVIWDLNGNWIMRPKYGWSYSPYYPYHSYPATTVVDQNGEIVFYSFDLYNQASDLEYFLTKNLVGGIYESTDYSQDGTVETIQESVQGNGINIILMGDGYSDRQIADGTYRADMEFAYRNLFTEEPYKSFRNLFDVSFVNVVSATEGYDYGNTALECQFGEGTYVYGNNSKCFEYALNAVSEGEMDETMIIVVMNSNAYAGTCFMYYPTSAVTDYGSGAAVAYFPKGGNETAFAQLLHHEACGHGFSKLADEYAYENTGTIPESEITETMAQQNNWGWWKNVDFTNNPSAIRWCHFLTDSRYAYDGLGAYEGGLTYWNGVWRPTENSIMRYNTGGFNAPSRESIYYRIHKLAYGDSWQYDYEDFVAYDAVNRKTEAGTYSSGIPYRHGKPLHPPVVVKKSWRDEM